MKASLPWFHERRKVIFYIGVILTALTFHPWLADHDKLRLVFCNLQSVHFRKHTTVTILEELHKDTRYAKLFVNRFNIQANVAELQSRHKQKHTGVARRVSCSQRTNLKKRRCKSSVVARAVTTLTVHPLFKKKKINVKKKDIIEWGAAE